VNPQNLNSLVINGADFIEQIGGGKKVGIKSYL